MTASSNAPTLTVNLSALAENYRILKSRFTGSNCAAVVKANAYGLGVEHVAKRLHQEDCTTFFVATLEEGIQLRRTLPHVRIFIFHGHYAGEEKEFLHHNLIPVINSLTQGARWPAEAPYALHVDTGINRLGLTLAELKQWTTPFAQCQLLMSHLACGGEPAHEKNAEQLQRFREARALFPTVPASFCNSSGVFLNKSFHFDLARPGCALYGINPTDALSPMKPVATLTAPILQIRHADRDDTVGYGATYPVKPGTPLAIIQMGYADGLFRYLSNKGYAYIGGKRVPFAGRVSMDMIVLDVSDIPEQTLMRATHAELLNTQYTVDHMAADAGTIGYEIFTRLGRRVKREYI